MKPRYVRCNGFVAVLTPHFCEALQLRAELLPATPIAEMLHRMWAAGVTDQCCGFKFGRGFIYYKPKWNERRIRWELELISFTPQNRFHTEAQNHAIRVYP